ncbi:MAG: 6,7-dimethyl-8-ribityllumazine synthase [Gemmatimonadota bacterium]|nr:6,7-dimethyl-8-ribityllumazine synthase [Gemmatimonadota bacterium]
MAELTGTARGEGRRLAVVASRFNEEITRPLSEGALDALTRHGVAFNDIDVIWVPGAWELPIAVRKALSSGRYDGVVAVGAVIRGDTPHFDIVAGESARGLMRASHDFDAPVALGLLTTDTLAQAQARAGGAHGNKGWDAALAVLELLDVLDQLEPEESCSPEKA